MEVTRIFLTKWFAKFAKTAGLTNEAIVFAAKEIQQGRIDARLGRNLLKQRVALPGHGKSGSVRCIIATKIGSHIFFLYGFKKSDSANISAADEKAMAEVAKDLLDQKDGKLKEALRDGRLVEVDQ